VNRTAEVDLAVAHQVLIMDVWKMTRRPSRFLNSYPPSINHGLQCFTICSYSIISRSLSAKPALFTQFIGLQTVPDTKVK
jgi:hypothetical protein